MRRNSVFLIPVIGLAFFVFAIAVLKTPEPRVGAFKAHDPGVRMGTPGAGGALNGLDPKTEAPFFNAGLAAFVEVDGVEEGLGPRFNAQSCAQCHAQPTIGGTSPFTNPLIAIATDRGAKNTIPSFVRPDGPITEARFKYGAGLTRDGGVHDLFVITGRDDLPVPNACNLTQPDFERELKKHNVSLRIPTPVFGGGLIEAIPDETIVANKMADAEAKKALGISGHENRSGNDGSITRFGWKAQNKSLLIFSGEAYNVEQGVTNELFPQERDNGGCATNATPEDHTHFDKTEPTEVLSDVEKFAHFMRLTAPPQPVNQTDPEVSRGQKLFASVGCASCHTPSMQTGKSNIEALSNQPVNLYSDLLVHNMGRGLKDDIVQGNAGPQDFRTAPLWGVGQRIFFMHDGRTKDLSEAIRAHQSDGSEANRVVNNYRNLSEADQQAILRFLRSL